MTFARRRKRSEEAWDDMVRAAPLPPVPITRHVVGLWLRLLANRIDPPPPAPLFEASEYLAPGESS